jgi:hypothetical protein
MKKQNNSTSSRLDNHEKLCRIMQKQTCDKMDDLSKQINRLEKILVGLAGLIISLLGAALIQLLR